MNSAPKGYYRQLLSDSFPMVRIAFTHTPMYGVKRVDNTNVLKVLDNSTDPYSKYYSEGLRNGSMVTIVECCDEDRYFSVGELYFKS